MEQKALTFGEDCINKISFIKIKDELILMK